MGTNALKVETATWDAEVGKAPGLVMVDFWAVWCGPCQMVAPIVDELAGEYAGKVKKAISVLKKRSGAHEESIRELRFGGSGIHLSEPLADFHGVLSGIQHLPANRPKAR